MGIAAIHQTIALAKQHEQRTGHLHGIVQRQLQRGVHLAIQVPEQKPVEALMEFILAYIEHVPSCLQAAWESTRAAQIEDYAAPILGLAEDYFLKPPEVVAGHIGLDELMDEAYLAHRLLEEMNDRILVRTGLPLVAMDMTMANLVVHSLIGEPFANELDEAVHFAVQQLMAREQVFLNRSFQEYIDKHRERQFQQQNLPCLMDKLSINLHFASHR